MVAPFAVPYVRADSRMRSALTQHISAAFSGVHASARSFRPSHTVFTCTSLPSAKVTVPQ